MIIAVLLVEWLICVSALSSQTLRTGRHKINYVDSGTH